MAFSVYMLNCLLCSFTRDRGGRPSLAVKGEKQAARAKEGEKRSKRGGCSGAPSVNSKMGWYKYRYSFGWHEIEWDRSRKWSSTARLLLSWVYQTSNTISWLPYASVIDLTRDAISRSIKGPTDYHSMILLAARLTLYVPYLRGCSSTYDQTA